MTNIIDVVTPTGEKHRHARSFQNGRVEVRDRPDGGFDVLGIRETTEVRSWGSSAPTRPASRTEDVLGSYPPGSTYTTR